MKKAELEESDYPKVAAMAARGLRVVDVAARLGIARSTWDALRQRDPRAAEACSPSVYPAR